MKLFFRSTDVPICYKPLLSGYPSSTTTLQQPSTSILTWRRGYRDHKGGSPRVRPFHCTAAGLTPAIIPNADNSGAQFLVVGTAYALSRSDIIKQNLLCFLCDYEVDVTLAYLSWLISKALIFCVYLFSRNGRSR